jgi:Glycosyl transferase family 2
VIEGGGLNENDASRLRIPSVRDQAEPPLGKFWEPIKVDRAHRRRLRKLGADKRRAAITIVHNEPVFLPIWLRYYSRFFAPEDLYVIDNDSTDGSTDRDGFVRIPAPHDRADNAWMVETVERLQNELIDGSYDVVLVTDVDEIVAPTPDWGDLGEYIDEFDEWWVNAIGYELIHLVDREDPIDLSRPILDQRRHWYANGAFNKPALATGPMSWLPGFHHRSDRQLNYDPNLCLIHLHRMDFDVCRERHLSRKDRPWSELDREEGFGVNNWPTEETEFERWFYEQSGFEDDGVQIVIERIPESWKGLF